MPSPLELASRWERQMTVEALQCHCQVQGQVLYTGTKHKQGPRGLGLILTPGPAGGGGVGSCSPMRWGTEAQGRGPAVSAEVDL